MDVEVVVKKLCKPAIVYILYFFEPSYLRYWIIP